nr:hypothetical protein [uncultured Cohaesibacter sp.]
MSPVVRISDAAFEGLRLISKWHETDTPSKSVDLLVRRELNRLGLEREVVEELIVDAVGTELIHFKEAPGLSFTKISFAQVDGQDVKKPNWASLLLEMVRALHSKGYSNSRLVSELQIPAKTGQFEESGFKFYRDLQISFQGQSAMDAWKEIERIARKFSISVEVIFHWRDNPKAQYPGKCGKLKVEFDGC